jgi:hypothetical protein
MSDRVTEDDGADAAGPRPTGTEVTSTGHTGPDPDARDRDAREEETELQASTPNAAGPERASGGMGVSSERVGHTGPGQESTDGEKDTTEPRHTDQAGDLVGSDAEFTQEPEENPAGLGPKADYPSRDPRSD